MKSNPHSAVPHEKIKLLCSSKLSLLKQDL